MYTPVKDPESYESIAENLTLISNLRKYVQIAQEKFDIYKQNNKLGKIVDEKRFMIIEDAKLNDIYHTITNESGAMLEAESIVDAFSRKISQSKM